MDATTYIKSISINSKAKPGPFGGLLLALATLLTPMAALAQAQSSTPQVYTSSQQPQNYSVLHVDATNGDDTGGTGDVLQPYKTVTQALANASTNSSTVILLAPGHYSQASGETLPLKLRPGITIQGNAGEARNTMIVGGGAVGTHSATVVMSDRSGLANVAISNPKGYGVWIGEGAPILRRVALVSNGVTGIHVNGGAPVIENSYFNGNQQGLVLEGNSRAIVRGNYFEATGRAITITNPATPTINNNRIARNEVGIALKNNARPVLDANILDQNVRNGVVEVDEIASAPASVAPVAAATPLGNVTAAPAPRVAPVALAPLASSAPSPVRLAPVETPAVLTTLENVDEESISVEVSDQDANAEITSPVAADEISSETEAIPPVAVDEISPETEVISLAVAEEPATADEIFSDEDFSEEMQPAKLLDRPAVDTVASPVENLEPTNTEPSAIEEERLDDADRLEAESNIALEDNGPDDDGIPIAVIPLDDAPPAAEVVPAASVDSNSRSNISKLLARLNDQPDEPAASGLPPQDEFDDSPSQRLPVPAAAIPSGLGGNRLPPPGTTSIVRTFRYRILVEMDDADNLRDLVPDAFRTRVGRRTFMQAGAYVDEAEARERLEWLEDNGIDANLNVRD